MAPRYQIIHHSQNGNFTYFSILDYFSNLKMEILILFSILDYFSDFKMEILTIFSILDYFSDFKMEIFTVFSILNCFSYLKMEILSVFSILNNKKIWKTSNRFRLTSQISFFVYTNLKKLIILLRFVYTLS